MRQYPIDSAPMGLKKAARLVTIERGAHPGGEDGQCSACHGPALRGVLLYTARDDFNPTVHAHSFLCIECAARIAVAVAIEIGALT